MIYGSICSGIESATVAWHPLGWTPAFFSEIDAFPRAVLAHRFPRVPLHGDFTTIEHGQYAAIDLLVGGTPCQSFSVAGLRKGFADQRGNLTLEFIRLAQRLRPRWLVWENVPGVLSIDGGRAFGSFLGGLAELGYGFAYRVLDAQYFGVPQRRRRVFLVAHLGGWTTPAAVLFEPESLRGDLAPRREKGKGVAPTISARTKGGGGLGTDFDCDGGLIAHPLRAEGFDASEDGTGRGTPLVPFTASTLKSNNGGGGFGSDPSETFIPIALDATQITSKENRSRPEPGDPYHPLTPVAFTCKDFGADAADISPTLRAMGHGSSHPNGGGQVAVAIPIQEVSKRTGVSTTDPRAGIGIGASGDPMYTLQSGAQHAVAFDLRGREGGAMPEGAHDTVNMRASSGGSSRSYLATAMAVRRITPREAERLQGFEDDWTLVPYRGKPAADGPRYKALGNAMAIPVMRWIGERIAMVEHLRISATCGNVISQRQTMEANT